MESNSLFQAVHRFVGIICTRLFHTSFIKLPCFLRNCCKSGVHHRSLRVTGSFEPKVHHHCVPSSRGGEANTVAREVWVGVDKDAFARYLVLVTRIYYHCVTSRS